MKIVKLVCDGGCSGNGKDGNLGGWGAVLVYGDHQKELYGSAKETTNNVMELTAAISGLSALQQKDIVVNVFSDSAYVVNCFRQNWYTKWQLNGWRNSKKEPVENRELWESLIALTHSFKEVHYYKIKGHLDPNKKADFKKWYTKFNAANGLNYSEEAFLEIVRLNHLADALANKGMDEIR